MFQSWAVRYVACSLLAFYKKMNIWHLCNGQTEMKINGRAPTAGFRRCYFAKSPYPFQFCFAYSNNLSQQNVSLKSVLRLCDFSFRWDWNLVGACLCGARKIILICTNRLSYVENIFSSVVSPPKATAGSICVTSLRHLVILPVVFVQQLTISRFSV